jgi:signal recognition particle receptor subunit beta
MAVFNYAGGEINAKIVYYGPGLSGKTTNLEFIYSKLPRENKGKMVSMKTRTDRTLFFDFLPIDIGEINGMKVRFLLYTVPGQVYYNATRKLVLKGVDALVFVADSAPDRMQENKESIQNLEDNLNDLGMTLKQTPWVIQLNKRDLPNVLDREIMERELNPSRVPSFEAVASAGTGVYETFEGIARLVFRNMQEALKDPDKSRGEAREQTKDEHINVEVVAKSTRDRNSETGESDYRRNAEIRDEEHKSVSEFVDKVLKEKERPPEGVSLGATREGYEEYGHVVELNDENGKERVQATKVEPKAEPKSGPKAESKVEPKAESKAQPRPEPPAAQPPREILTDPLEKLKSQAPEKAEQERAIAVETERPVVREKTIRVPVRLSKDDGRKEIRLNVVLEIDVE